jgi:tRNA A-37 threonylcarbamoyl transferase component Bud32
MIRWWGVSFANLYAYGHLPALAFSLSVAMACAVVALRIPGARRDLALSLVYLYTAVTTGVEMLLALRPSVWAGRAYLASGGVVFLSLVVTFHLHYAEVLPEARRRIYWKAIAGLTGYGALLLVLMMAGVLDGGHTRAVTLWGARSALPAMPLWACLLCALFSFANVPLCAEIYQRNKGKGSWLVSSGVWAGPLVAVWDLSICAGLNPWVPFGGYLAAVVGVEGAVQLVERLRTMPPPESTIAGYHLERRLGRGGMADVFLAHRRSVGGMEGVVQRVALKRLRTDHADDPHFVRMFLDEARILARLSHPNIVQLYDAGFDSGQLFLAMELVDGTTLEVIYNAAHAQRQRLSMAVVVEIGAQMCAALETAHRLTAEDGRPLELVHRDISPQNVLVDRHGTVKLSDFGIARSTDRLTETATGVVKGKMTYMAPEQIQGRAYDQRVDLYALAVVLFELLTGERLYRSQTEAQLLYEILEGQRDRLGLLTQHEPKLAELLRASLAADPERRPASAAVMRAELEALRKQAVARDELARWVATALSWGRGEGDTRPMEEVAAQTRAGKRT